MPPLPRKRKRDMNVDEETEQIRSKPTRMSARLSTKCELPETPPRRKSKSISKTRSESEQVGPESDCVDGLLTPTATPVEGRRSNRIKLASAPKTVEADQTTESNARPSSKRAQSDTVLTRRATKLKSNYFKPAPKVKTPGFAKPELARNHVPPLTAKCFGLIQERFWHEPFQMLVAVVFLNRTKGMHAMPVFFKLIEKWPTAKDLSDAPQEEIAAMLQHLGLQNQRAKGLISLAKAWVESPPDIARRYRTFNYPSVGDGKDIKLAEVLEMEDVRVGCLEVAHLPRLGPYGWDSWRIFCKDVLLGLAEDYNGLGAPAGFEPEWKRVLPLDKELRACLRWMWLREGWLWNPEDGSRKKASVEIIVRTNEGNMLWEELIEAT